jgi:hypothetical protein
MPALPFSSALCRSITTLWCSCVCAIAGAGNYLRVGETIELQLSSGHRVAGTVDERTDAEMVWLKREIGGVTLWSGFSLSRVASWIATDNGDQSRSSDAPVADTSISLNANVPATVYEVTSLEIVAGLGQWDSDAPPDGLQLWVRPLDSWGWSVPVHGNIDVKLLAQRRPWRGGMIPRREPQFVELERWTVTLRSTDFGPDGAPLRLAFRKFVPDREFDILPLALVTARLNIAGVGSFDASAPDVYIRSSSRIRDDLQQFIGQRYFPQEFTRDVSRRYPHESRRASYWQFRM